MRTRSRRRVTTINNPTIVAGVDPIGITADFAGGFVMVSFLANALGVGVGQWITGSIKVDGVTQSVAYGAYQSGTNISISFSQLILVPSGRHRISAALGAAVTIATANGSLVLSVSE